MNLLLVGLSHRTAPVAVRERYAVAADQVRGLDEKLVQEAVCDEAALVSTCNRTELVTVTHDLPGMADRAHAFFAREIGDGSARLQHLYELHQVEVVRHVFRVATSLDSMVVGEAQILGQLKAAHRAAVSGRSCGPLLNRLFERAFRTAKRVRTETGLGASPVSVARVGVQLAAEVFERLDDKRVLLVGAGEMAESALHGLREAGAADLVVLNRTLATAQHLAQRFAARAAPLEALAEELSGADIALASVQVDQPLLGPADLAPCMRERPGRPLLMIDLGIPRNLDPACNAVDDLYLYDLDDLDAVAADGRARRQDAVAPAEAIVEREVELYERWKASLAAVPVMRELQLRAHELALAEIGRSGAAHSPEAREALERLAHGIAQKLLHTPLERLRAEAAEGRAPYYADAVRHIFGLAEEDE